MKRGCSVWSSLLPPAFVLIWSCGCAPRAAQWDRGLVRTAGHAPDNRTTPHVPQAEPPATLDDRAALLPDLDITAELDHYLIYAALNNPGLEAAFHRWMAAVERVPQVQSLPDPRLSYRYFIEEVETRTGPQEQGLGLSQTIPWIGKLALRGDVAAQAAEAARQRYEAAKLALFHEVKDAYCEHYYLGRALIVVQENSELVERLEGVVRARYRGGQEGQPQVIRVQIERSRLEDQHRSLQDLTAPSAARLNAALNRPAPASVPLPAELPAYPMQLDNDAIRQQLSTNNPQLRALDHDIARAEASVALARTSVWPDLTFGVDYTEIGSPPRRSPAGLGSPAAVRGLSNIAGGAGSALDAYSIGHSLLPGSKPDDAGQDVWMVSLSLNIPVWHDKYAAEVRQARDELQVALALRRDLENQLSAQLVRALYEQRDAGRKAELYSQTLIPKAREALRATEASFRNGTASFLDLVDAERTLLEFQLSYERARSHRAQYMALIERLTGLPLLTTPQVTAEDAGEAP